MSDFNGDDLLSVFNELHIHLHSLSPNVIKAWFDTDDKNMKNLLTWICTSLSKQNYVCPLEYAEFLELETPLVDQKYDQEYHNIEREYPGIFDADTNDLDIKLIEDEIEIIMEEEEYLDRLIIMNETLQTDLSEELADKTSEEIRTSLKLKSKQEICNSLGKQLDEVNTKLHSQLVKYGSNLYSFEFGAVPNFINNLNVKECEENFNNVVSFITPVLEDDFLLVNVTSNITGLENGTMLESLNVNNSVMNNLCALRHRILHSHQNYLVTKIEVEKMKEITAFVDKFNMDSVLSLTDSFYYQLSRENKEETKRRMCGMLDNISVKLADYHIAQTKLKYAQEELETFQLKLNSLKKTENAIVKFLSYYFLLSILFSQEKEDIDCSDKFFRKILNYISKDLQNCSNRTKRMKEIICDYEKYTGRPISDRYKLIRPIIKILSNEEDFNLGKAVEVVGEFKNELNVLENKLFQTDFVEHRVISEKIKHDIQILQSFLICGPTHRIVLVPSELQLVLRQLEDHLKKQITSVKSAVQISSTVKKLPTKWQNYRRQLWMYFYTDRQKLSFVIQQIEEEFKKHKKVTDKQW